MLLGTFTSAISHTMLFATAAAVADILAQCRAQFSVDAAWGAQFDTAGRRIAYHMFLNSTAWSSACSVCQTDDY